MDITVENKISHILVTASGPLSLDDAGWRKIDTAKEEIVSMIRDTKNFKILFDCRGLSGTMSITDRFLLAMVFVKENIKFVTGHFPPLKIALVADPSLRDPQKIGEKVARNRGLYGFVATDIDTALKWLDENGSNGKTP
jgi:hypothetical protein